MFVVGNYPRRLKMILCCAGLVVGRFESSPMELPNCQLCFFNISAWHGSHKCSADSSYIVDVGSSHSFLSDETINAGQSCGRIEIYQCW